MDWDQVEIDELFTRLDTIQASLDLIAELLEGSNLLGFVFMGMGIAYFVIKKIFYQQVPR